MFAVGVIPAIRRATWTPTLFVALTLAPGSLSIAQEHESDRDASRNELLEAPEGAHEEHSHRNALGFILANTYEAEEQVNFFTVGAEYSRGFTERFDVVFEFEYLPKPNAWIFVAPLVVKVAGELEVFAGPGIEHRSRRASSGEGGEGEHGERAAEGGADNLFLFRFGVGYHFSLGERFFLVPHALLDLVDEQSGVAKAVVYGVNVGFGF
jgi:hypothetical protein